MNEKVPIAKVEIRDADTEVQHPINLAEIKQRRAEVMAAFDREISAVAERLMALVPSQLNDFAAEALNPASSFVSTIIQYGSKEIKLKEPSDYGFENDDDVAAKMTALKNAWAGIVDVDIRTSDSYVVVVFKPAE